MAMLTFQTASQSQMLNQSANLDLKPNHREFLALVRELAVAMTTRVSPEARLTALPIRRL
jgi:hypothetical protein